jgi:poly-gamma-glutamate synthesis protein (capsule biosynthesis protein)
VLLGHHPHILQGVEKYRGRIIAYSLGDFIFDLWQLRLRESMILRLQLDDPDDIGYDVRPMLINRRWQPQVITGVEAAKLKSEIEALSHMIDENADEQAWAREVAQELRRFRRSVYFHYLCNLHRFGAKSLLDNVKGIIKRRRR